MPCLHFQLTSIIALANGIWNNRNDSIAIGNMINVGEKCDQLLQQFHRFDEELSVQGKWQGGTVTGVCKGWGTNKVCIMTADHAICIF